MSARPTPAAAPAVAHEAPRDAASDPALTLARAITPDRAAQDGAQLLRRLAGVDAVAVGIVVGEDPTRLHLAAEIGFEDVDAARTRLDGTWAQVIASGGPLATDSGDGVEVCLPLGTPGALVGALLALSEGSTDPDLATVRRHAEALAPHLAAALERTAAIRRAEQRQRLDAIGEVAAGLAHELRNPLFGISSAAQLLRYRVTEDPVVEKNVGRILREVERLNTMVTALLEYGRPSPFHLEPADPDTVWDGVLAQQRGRLESKALRVERSRAPEPFTGPIDRSHLAQAFVNLLDNAIDAAPEGTDLSLASTILPSGAWRCRLVNGGTPIAPDALARIFDLFFSTKPGGTGIGLPLCQRIVEEHGGTLVVESDARSGTAATVTLPRRP